LQVEIIGDQKISIELCEIIGNNQAGIILEADAIALVENSDLRGNREVPGMLNSGKD